MLPPPGIMSLLRRQRMFLTGFSAIDRARLKTLSAEALAGLVKSDEIELMYAHLSSMRNFQGMRDRVGKVSAGAASIAAADPVPDEPREERPAKTGKGPETGKQGAPSKKR